MHESGLTTVHPHRAKAIRVTAGERLRIRPLLPDLMADLWALCEDDPTEYLSVQHSRLHAGNTALRNGDALVSNRGHAVLTWVDGPVPAARAALNTRCHAGPCHRHGHYKPGQCEDRFRDAVGYALFGPAKAPCPLTLFARHSHDMDAMDWLPTQPPSASILLRAEINLIVLLSAIPSDAMAGIEAPLSGQTAAIQIQRIPPGSDHPNPPPHLCDQMPMAARSCIPSSTN